MYLSRTLKTKCGIITTMNLSGQTMCHVTWPWHIFQLQYPNGAPSVHYPESHIWTVCRVALYTIENDVYLSNLMHHNQRTEVTGNVSDSLKTLRLRKTVRNLLRPLNHLRSVMPQVTEDLTYLWAAAIRNGPPSHHHRQLHLVLVHNLRRWTF